MDEVVSSVLDCTKCSDIIARFCPHGHDDPLRLCSVSQTRCSAVWGTASPQDTRCRAALAGAVPVGAAAEGQALEVDRGRALVAAVGLLAGEGAMVLLVLGLGWGLGCFPVCLCRCRVWAMEVVWL